MIVTLCDHNKKHEMKSFWSTLVFAILGLAFVQKPSLAASPDVVSDEILKNGCIPWRVSGKELRSHLSMTELILMLFMHFVLQDWPMPRNDALLY